MKIFQNLKIVFTLLITFFIFYLNAQNNVLIENRATGKYLAAENDKCSLTENKDSAIARWNIISTGQNKSFKIQHVLSKKFLDMDGKLSNEEDERIIWKIDFSKYSNFLTIRNLSMLYLNGEGSLISYVIVPPNQFEPYTMHWTINDGLEDSGIFGGEAIKDLKIMTYNVYLLDARNPNDDLDDRANNIAKSSFIHKNDILILDENFIHYWIPGYAKRPARNLMTSLIPSYPFQTEISGVDRSFDENLGYDRGSDYAKKEGWYAPLNGGVVILSKHLIIETAQFTFRPDELCGADAFAAKGFIYAKINYRGEKINIIATHTQAEDKACPESSKLNFSSKGAEHRLRNFQEIRQFLRRKNIPKDEYVFFVGDLNVNRGTAEYDNMLKVLNAAAPNYAGHSSTWDPETNNLLKKNGWKPSEYSSEFLDFILVSKNHKQPKGWTNTAIKTPSNIELSDHYPVVGSIKK